MKRFWLSLLVATASIPAWSADQTGYIEQLRAKYEDRLIFADEAIKKRVEEFDIDCESDDGRYLPLVNILYAKLAEADTANAWLVTTVLADEDDVWVLDEVHNENGPVAPFMESFKITPDDELFPIGITGEAVLNACYGSYGSIWVMPE